MPNFNFNFISIIIRIYLTIYQVMCKSWGEKIQTYLERLVNLGWILYLEKFNLVNRRVLVWAAVWDSWDKDLKPVTTTNVQLRK